VVVQRGQSRGRTRSGQQGASAHLIGRPGRAQAVLFVVEGIDLAAAIALPMCQSPLCWRAVDTNLVDLLWWGGEAGAVVLVVEC
jgi:hypothetical protein